MNSQVKLLAVLLVGLLAGGGGVWLAQRPHAPQATGAEQPAATAPANDEKKVLYWYDPMVPDQHFDKPGKSPFMDMDLVPKYAGEDDGAGVSIDPRVAQNLGVRTAEAETGRLWRRIDTVGYVRPDENRIQVLQTRAAGWIEDLRVHAEGDPVRKGQLIAKVYSPDLYAAQEEYLLARKHPDDGAWLSAARQKLIFLGMSDGEINQLDKSGQAFSRVPYTAPADGIVSRIGVHEGASVTARMPLLEITDLSRVWVTAEVMEEQAAWIAAGKYADVSVDSLPGQLFEGRIDYVYPEVNSATRTHPVRIVLANPGLKLKPGMFAKVTLYGGKGDEGVIVPSEAVIQTGKRTIVLVAQGEGRYAPVPVKTGMEHDGQTLIKEGLAGGEKVVTSGQFLIESEANLKGALDKLGGPGGAIHTGTARIVKANAHTGELEMQHDPIPSLKWPAMTMEFAVKDKAMLKGLKPGEAVEFDLVKKGGEFPVVAIRPRPSGSTPAAASQSGGHAP